MLEDLRRHGGTVVPFYFSKARTTATLLGAAGVPVLFLRSTNDPFNLPKLALLLSVVGVAAAALAIEALQGRRFPALAIMRAPALALAIPLLIATALSPYRWWSLLGEYQRFQGLIPHLLVIALGLLVAASFPGEARTPAHWFSLAGAIAGGYSVLQYLGVDLFEWGAQVGGGVEVTSTLGNTNFSGGFLAICLPVAVSLWLMERSPKRFLVAALIAGGVLVSFSQGAWVASAAGVIFGAGLYFSERINWAHIAGAGLAVLLALTSFGYVVRGIVQPSDRGVADTVQLRSWWWESAIDMTLAHPIVGRGPNSFVVESWAYRTFDEASTQTFDYTDDPHSGYLSIATGAGLLGLGGLLFALGWAVRRAWGNRNVVLAAGAGGGVVAYAVDAISTVDELSLRIGLWVCIGLLVAATMPSDRSTLPTPKTKSKGRKHSQPRSHPLRKPWAVVGCLLVAFAVTGYSLALVFTDAQIRYAVQDFRTGEVEQARDRFESALAVWPSNDYRHNYAFFLGELAIASEDADLMEESAKEYSYLESFPDVASLRDRGRSFAQFSEFDREWLEPAADSYAEAMSIDRYNAVLIPEGADVLLRARRYKQLIDVVEPVLDALGPRAPSLWPIVGLAYVEVGDLAAAEASLEQALAIAPDDLRTIELQEILAQGNPPQGQET